MHNKTIEKLIYQFSKLPGIGGRTAKRVILHLIKNREHLIMPLARALADSVQVLQECEVCKNIDEGQKCSICSDSRRDQKIICVVESIIDVWALEEAKFYKGLYHILGGTLSSVNNRNPHSINIEGLIKRIETQDTKEVIIATNATMEGQTTAFFITEKLRPYPHVKVTRFAHGVPIGGELEYLDEVTLSTAFNARQDF